MAVYHCVHREDDFDRRKTREVLTQEHAEKAIEFLEASDQEFAAGDIFQGSEKLWGAASHAVMAVAGRNGKALTSHRAFRSEVRRLARRHNAPSLWEEFRAAEMFHANFYHGFMEDFQIDEDRPAVHRFVRRLLALNGAPDVARGS